ncbi:MAG: hypothetical protein CMM94_08000 [Rickettsiales bacterium]|nr:hypothetical protein [Rickettsiales bacterium]|tara:strand:+ start:642 stop:1130 length:489 start_codon:yes stop_codon:yes gene_type:complete
MRLTSKLIVAVSALALVACNQQGGIGNAGTKQTVGTVGGAVVGGVLGSKIGGGTGQGIAIGVGTLLGALAGSEIGKSLDRSDMLYAQQTNQRALETAQPGQSLPWSNPETGNRGTVTPSNYYQTASGQYCREFSQTIYVDGRSEKGYGTACRQADGSWQIVN